MNKDLKRIFKNSGITTVIILIYGIIIEKNSVYIASTMGAILSLWNLYSIYKDAELMIHLKDPSKQRRLFAYMKRLVINGIFLVLMIKVDFQWFICGALGLLVVKFNIILMMLKEQINNIVEKLKI